VNVIKETVTGLWVGIAAAMALGLCPTHRGKVTAEEGESMTDSDRARAVDVPVNDEPQRIIQRGTVTVCSKPRPRR